MRTPPHSSLLYPFSNCRNGKVKRGRRLSSSFMSHFHDTHPRPEANISDWCPFPYPLSLWLTAVLMAASAFAYSKKLFRPTSFSLPDIEAYLLVRCKLCHYRFPRTDMPMSSLQYLLSHITMTAQCHILPWFSTTPSVQGRV